MFHDVKKGAFLVAEIVEVGADPGEPADEAGPVALVYFSNKPVEMAWRGKRIDVAEETHSNRR